MVFPLRGQTVRSNSFEIPYVETAPINPLKEPASEFKYREALGMARIIPVFATSFPTEYRAAVSYACQLMEERLPTCYPIYVNFKEKIMGNQAVRVLVNYTEIQSFDGTLTHLLNNATIKRAETYTQDPIYPKPLKIGEDYPDGEIILSTKDIYYNGLIPEECPKDKYDLVTLVLHSLGRILGMDITAYPANQNSLEESISPFIVVGDVTSSNPKGFKTISSAPNYAPAILYSNLAPTEFDKFSITHNHWHNTFHQERYKDGDWYRIATSQQPVIICPLGDKNRKYKLHSEYGKYMPQSLRFFAIEPENRETLLFQPIIKKGVAIHHIGRGFIDALLVSGWVESNPFFVGIGNEQKEANSGVNKEFMIFPKSSSPTRVFSTDPYVLSSTDVGYNAYSFDKRGTISKHETGLYVQRKDGRMEKIFSYEHSYQFPGNLDQFCGENPMTYFAGRNMDAYAKTSDGLIKLMNVGCLDNTNIPQTYIRYLYAMVEPERPKYTIDGNTNILCFMERFFSQEMEVVETEYLFGEPIYTTYPVLPGEYNVQLSSEDSDVTIVARNKAGETKTFLRRFKTEKAIAVTINGKNVTIKSKIPIHSCQVRSIMPVEDVQVTRSDRYTCSGKINKEGKFIAFVVDCNHDLHTAQFIVQ